MGRPKSKVARVRVVGPLQPFAAGFHKWLKQTGYTSDVDLDHRGTAHGRRWDERHLDGLKVPTGRPTQTPITGVRRRYRRTPAHVQRPRRTGGNPTP
jgi:hypothetical protein